MASSLENRVSLINKFRTILRSGPVVLTGACVGITWKVVKTQNAGPLSRVSGSVGLGQA